MHRSRSANDYRPHGATTTGQRHEAPTDRSDPRSANLRRCGDVLGDCMSEYDSRPGSAWMDEREELAQRFATIQPTKPKRTRAELLKADPDAWETMAEPWETAEPVTQECANCGLTAHHAEMQEAKRRCGTGYGEWYCVDGHGCQE